MKQLTTNPDLNNMLNQLRDNVKNESLFKLSMDPDGSMRVNGKQYVCNERIFNEFRDEIEGDLNDRY